MEHKMTSGKISSTILKFAAPILIGQILQQLYNIIDSIIVGRYIGVEALAAVGATWSLSYIVCYFCIGTCMGISVPLSQEYGAGNMEKLRRYFINGIYFVLALAVVVTGVTTLLCRHFLVWLQTPENILDGADTYLFIIFLGLPFTILYNFCFGVLMAFGDSKKSSVFMAVSTVMNLGLDIITIVEWNWGIAGAAISTIVSQGIAGICSLCYILKKYRMLYPMKEEYGFRWDYIRNIIRMSMPMGAQYSVTAIGAIILQYSVNHLGSDAVAVYSAGSKIKGFFLCPLNALGTALSAFVGQNFGAGNMKRIKEGLGCTVKMGILYSLAVIVIIFFAGDFLALLFVNADNMVVIGYTRKFLFYISFFHLELAVLFAFRYCVQGMGYGRFSIYSGTAEMLGRALVAIFLVPVFGFEAVCWNEGVTFLAGIAVIVPLYFWIERKFIDW